MNEPVLFREKQKFSQWWLWLILFSVNGIFIYALFYQVVGGQQWGDTPLSDTGLVLISTGSFLLSFLFYNIHLDTMIKSDGIYVRFFPFQRIHRHYPWPGILRSYVRQYKPIKEFGGWGWRLDWFGHGQAWSVTGNKGLQLEFTSKRKLLIGTQKPEELTRILEELGQLKN